MPGSIDLLTKDGVAYLILNNPEKKNAISAEMWEQLSYHAEILTQDNNTRVVVLRGHGMSSFAAGADISQFESKRSASTQGSSYDDLTESAIAALKSIPVPVIAMIQGFCLGGAISLALACDLRFASNKATFSIPAARLGTAYPTPAIERLVNQIGAANAKFLLFSAQRIGAESAKEMHLVDRIFNHEELEEKVSNFAASLLDNAPLTLKSSKFTIDQQALESKNRDYTRIHQFARDCFESQDYKEGVSAFMSSRKPNFKGQ